MWVVIEWCSGWHDDGVSKVHGPFSRLGNAEEFAEKIEHADVWYVNDQEVCAC